MIRRLLSISAVALLAVSCSSPSTTESNASSASSSANTDTVQIVASTQVWADVAEKVVPNAEIKPIITGQDIDPHSFEPTASDLAEARDADIIVVGGGGYDAWLYNGVEEQKVIHALPLSEGHSHQGHSHDDHSHKEHSHEGEGDHNHHGHGANEHIWFDTHAVADLAVDLAKKVNEVSPTTETTPEKVEDSLKQANDLIHALPDAKVAQTHAIADLVIAHSNMQDVTPEGYHHSSVNESEPTAADVAAFLDLVNAKGLDVLIDAPQTATDTTKRIREAAEQQGIKIVDVYEMPKKDENYFDFLNDFAQRLSDAAK
ncbi:metal ABC transporter solute-binding protein, Zn/Mn family [Corynebacterium freiburgense]|uniref:metal ABC transporter solute-binding protein, Zn/Mn family n=1 Tax=Corynebacterium freiburgense TaxID=556548 RepID=UPI000415FBBD|nr:zinc ABC transporter substrate-binding protein [Corynebacterium freiburgense]WJZ03645.1 high-affinity zinc transporter periplasmic component [Corynebacterium freiburgense]